MAVQGKFPVWVINSFLKKIYFSMYFKRISAFCCQAVMFFFFFFRESSNFLTYTVPKECRGRKLAQAIFHTYSERYVKVTHYLKMLRKNCSDMCKCIVWIVQGFANTV